jgi:hypothetical protein
MSQDIVGADFTVKNERGPVLMRGSDIKRTASGIMLNKTNGSSNLRERAFWIKG